MITKIDFANKTHITYIIISIIILFGIIYIWQNFKSNKHIDGFTQYNVNSDDAVTLFALDNVLIGNENLTLPQKLESLYYKITDGSNMDKRLSTDIDTIKSEFAAYKTTVTGIIATNKTELLTSISNNKITLQNNIDANISHLTIIAYYNATAPPGWQICDGAQLKAEDNTTLVYYKTSTTGTPTKLNTPDLRGRSILGANLVSNSNSSFTTSLIGNSGGEERHTLSEAEMPRHSHDHDIHRSGSDNCGPLNTFDCGNWGGVKAPSSLIQYAGGSASHNNMHPVYVLNYIIKQPKLGGDTNSILLQAAPSTANIF